jgi:hypothetical protein
VVNEPESGPGHNMSLWQALIVIPAAFLFIRFVVLPIVEPIAQAVSAALFQ